MFLNALLFNIYVTHLESRNLQRADNYRVEISQLNHDSQPYVNRRYYLTPHIELSDSPAKFEKLRAGVGHSTSSNNRIKPGLNLY